MVERGAGLTLALSWSSDHEHHAADRRPAPTAAAAAAGAVGIAAAPIQPSCRDTLHAVASRRRNRRRRRRLGVDNGSCIIATTDFFMPMVDDPHDFGRIAATNAISDVYAMGGTPIMALAILGMPVDKIPPEMVRKILEGGARLRGCGHSRASIDRRSRSMASR
jgi:selenophosphate synthase